MNTLKFTSKIKETVLILLKNRIPLKLTAVLINLSEATLRNHIPEEYKSDLSDFKMNSNTQKLHLIQVYAWLLADELDCIASFGTPVISGLVKLLPAYLHLEEWTRFIDGIIFYKNFNECNKFAPNVPIGYQKLIEELYPSPKIKLEGKELLSKIFKQMHRGEIPFPNEDDVNDIKKFLSPYIEKELITNPANQSLDQLFVPKKENRYFDFDFTEELCKFIDVGILGYLQRECLESYFGITEVTVGELSEKYNLTLQRLGQLKNKAVRKLQYCFYYSNHTMLIERGITDYIKLYNEFSSVSTQLKESLVKIENLDRAAVESINALREKMRILVLTIRSFDEHGQMMKHDKVRKIIEQDFPEEVKSLSEAENDELRSVLRTPLEDLELSVRAFNCLKAAKINTLRELVVYFPEELMKLRFFGQKTLTELEEVLRERKLRFGMVL